MDKQQQSIPPRGRGVARSGRGYGRGNSGNSKNLFSNWSNALIIC
jgi:hypothetical protein